jgi:hypothetical protein
MAHGLAFGLGVITAIVAVLGMIYYRWLIVVIIGLAACGGLGAALGYAWFGVGGAMAAGSAGFLFCCWLIRKSDELIFDH